MHKLIMVMHLKKQHGKRLFYHILLSVQASHTVCN